MQAFPVHCMMDRLAAMQNVTDRRTNKQTDSRADSVMPIADHIHTACSALRSAKMSLYRRYR